MSLTSRISSFFSQSPATENTLQGQHHDFNTPDLQIDRSRQNKNLHTMAASAEEDDLELKRPPYIHVSPAGPPQSSP